MPSWPIHISIANKLNKQLKLNDDFILGNILPDTLDGYIFKASNTTHKNKSHFRTNERIDLDLFLKSNKNKLDNPIVLGYLTHLLSDKFYNSYTSKNHIFETNEGLKVLLNDNTYMDRNEVTLKMKQNDYIKYGKYLAKQNMLGNTIKINENTFQNLKALTDFDYSKEDIDKTIDIINMWINDKSYKDDVKYELYSKEELDNVYNDCIEFIFRYLDKLKETS